MRTCYLGVTHRSVRLKVVVGLMITFLLFSMSGCSGYEPDEPVDRLTMHHSSENISRIFAQAIFEGDLESLISCFPTSYSDMLTQEDDDLLEKWAEQMQNNLKEVGLKVVGTRAGTSQLQYESQTQGYDYSVIFISVEHFVAAPDIDEIRFCPVRVFVEDEDALHYMDINVMTYKTQNKWYAIVTDEMIPKEDTNDDAT